MSSFSFNPNAEDFVPRAKSSTLNASASEFTPSSFNRIESGLDLEQLNGRSVHFDGSNRSATWSQEVPYWNPYPAPVRQYPVIYCPPVQNQYQAYQPKMIRIIPVQRVPPMHIASERVFTDNYIREIENLTAKVKSLEAERDTERNKRFTAEEKIGKIEMDYERLLKENKEKHEKIIHLEEVAARQRNEEEKQRQAVEKELKLALKGKAIEISRGEDFQERLVEAEKQRDIAVNQTVFLLARLEEYSKDKSVIEKRRQDLEKRLHDASQEMKRLHEKTPMDKNERSIGITRDIAHKIWSAFDEYITGIQERTTAKIEKLEQRRFVRKSTKRTKIAEEREALDIMKKIENEIKTQMKTLIDVLGDNQN